MMTTYQPAKLKYILPLDAGFRPAVLAHYLAMAVDHSPAGLYNSSIAFGDVQTITFKYQSQSG